MKLGLITDIHEHLVTLRRALEHLAELGVGKIVMIGDVVELGLRLEGTCQLLAEAQVVGVWGNHDFGLCSEFAARRGSPDPAETGDRRSPGVAVRETCGRDEGGVGRPSPNPISPRVRSSMGTLQPRLVVEECHFSHVEPWLD